jgi:hypothetical protein
MNSEPENFEPLRRLLMLKRHEQPPPGFFNDFSRRIILRIQAGETGQEALGIGLMFWKAPWLRSFLSALEQKPALAGAFSLGVCGLLLAGILCSVAPADPGKPDLLGASQSLAAIAVPQAADPSPVFVSSTNGLLPGPLQDSPFQQFGSSQGQPHLIRVSAEPLIDR